MMHIITAEGFWKRSELLQPCGYHKAGLFDGAPPDFADRIPRGLVILSSIQLTMNDDDVDTMLI